MSYAVFDDLGYHCNGADDYDASNFTYIHKHRGERREGGREGGEGASSHASLANVYRVAKLPM